jgi:hypothetical protein
MSEICKTCGQVPQADCDWQQGRCPHREPLINIQPKDTSRGHFYVSMVKSALRISAGVYLIHGDLFTAGALLIAAEVLGIVEEIV